MPDEPDEHDIAGVLSAFAYHVAGWGGAALVLLTILGYVNELMEWGAGNRVAAGSLIFLYFGAYVVRYASEADRRLADKWRSGREDIHDD